MDANTIAMIKAVGGSKSTVPFFGETKQTVEVLAECQPPWNENEGAFILNNTLGLTGGNTYIVNWNGTEYVCTAVSSVHEDGSELVMIGNQAVGGGEDSGEPFGIIDIGYDGSALFVPLDGSTSVTLSIKQEQTVIHHLDPKYIKDMYHETKEVVEILPECQPIYVEGSQTPFVFTTPAELTTGEKYSVNWNGVDYVSTAYDGAIAGHSGAVALVNDGANMNTGEGAVFLICFFPVADEGAYGFAQTFDGTTELTISIRQEQTTIVPIDGKYLPEGVPYIEEGMVEILPECQPAFVFVEDIGVFMLDEALGLADGETYKVNWNGVEYSCVAEDEVNASTGEVTNTNLGNVAVMVGSGDTGEPFVIVAVYNEGMTVIMPLDGSTELTISIKGKGEVPHKLPATCLPDDATVFYLNSPGGKKFAVTVSDDGALSAAEVTE